MRRLGGVIAVAALALIAGCGGDDTAQSAGTDFSPLAAEEYVRIKARTDVQSHPSLVLRDIAEPDVNCEQTEPDDQTPVGTARFRCNVEVSTEGGESLAKERWEVTVGQDPTTGDLAVRNARRTSTNIPPARDP